MYLKLNLIYIIFNISKFNIKSYNYFYSCRDSYPMLLVGNKIDLVHQRKVSEEMGREMSQRLNVGFIETSAKDPPHNVDAAFHDVRYYF